MYKVKCKNGAIRYSFAGNKKEQTKVYAFQKHRKFSLHLEQPNRKVNLYLRIKNKKVYGVLKVNNKFYGINHRNWSKFDQDLQKIVTTSYKNRNTLNSLKKKMVLKGIQTRLRKFVKKHIKKPLELKNYVVYTPSHLNANIANFLQIFGLE